MRVALFAQVERRCDVTKRIISVNDRGLRIGEDHPKAKLTDHEVDLIREMAEDRDENGRRKWGRRRLARKFDVSTWTIRSILDCASRAQIPAAYRTIDSGADA
jgi:hypothetical protein